MVPYISPRDCTSGLDPWNDAQSHPLFGLFAVWMMSRGGYSTSNVTYSLEFLNYFLHLLYAPFLHIGGGKFSRSIVLVWLDVCSWPGMRPYLGDLFVLWVVFKEEPQVLICDINIRIASQSAMFFHGFLSTLKTRINTRSFTTYMGTIPEKAYRLILFAICLSVSDM